jgi:hypothetical protein
VVGPLNMSLIRVFALPHKSRFADWDYLFSAGKPVEFYQVDGFRDDHHPLTAESEKEYREFIGGKRYTKITKEDGFGLLILGPEYSFTIDYEAP